MALDRINATALLDGGVTTADIADDAVTTAKINAGAVDTTELASGAVTSAKLATQTGNVDFADNAYIRLGDSQDLQIYHDSSNSIIKDTGTGRLQLLSNRLDINKSDGTEGMATFIEDAQVILYYDNNVKLQTTSAGIDVTGTTFNLDGGGSNPALNVKNSATYFSTLTHDTLNVQQNALKFNINGTEHMRIDANGHVTKPLQPAFLVQPSAQQSNFGADGNNDTISFGTERFDVGSNFASNTFTAPVTGKYMLSANLYLTDIDSGTNYYQMTLYTSNRSYYFAYDVSSSDQDPNRHTFQVNVIADMDSGDQAFIMVLQSSGTSQTDVATESYFSGALLC